MIEIKFPCARCGQNIACEETVSGLTVNCPACQAAVAVPDAREWQAIRPKDVFIIYRNGSGGEHLARLVREGLGKRSFEVFADEDSAKNGGLANFKKIELATDIVVIFNRDCFDGCESEDDGLRQEIRHAIRKGKNIVPVIDRYFSNPAKPLPPDIAEVLFYNGLTPAPDLWEPSLDRLVADFLNSKTTALAQQSRNELSKGKPLAIFAGVVAMLGIFIGLACVPQISLLGRSGRVPNLVIIDKVTLAFVFGLNLLLTGGAVLIYSLHALGLKLLNSSASGLILANTACSVAYIVAARGYGITSFAAAGPPALIWVVTVAPLVMINQRAGNLLKTTAVQSKTSQ